MEKYISSSENFHDLSSLKELSGKKQTIHSRNFYHDKKIPDTEPIQKLAHFSDCIKNGILPDGIILEHLANCIHNYLEGRKETMDSALGLHAKPKKGNAAKNFQDEKKQSKKLNEIAYEKGVNGKKQKDAARAVYKYYNPDCENDLIGGETLERQYRKRSNRKGIEKDIKGVHSRFLEKADD